MVAWVCTTIGRLWSQNTCHILDADGRGPHLLHLFGQYHIVFQGVDRAGGIGNGARGLSATGNGLLHGYPQILYIIERIKNSDDVDTVLYGAADKGPDHLIRIVMISQHILSPQQHLQLGVLHLRADVSQPLPRVLLQVTQADIKGRTAPTLHGIKARLVDGLQNWRKLPKSQPSGHQRLVGIPQNVFSKLNCHRDTSNEIFFISYHTFPNL